MLPPSTPKSYTTLVDEIARAVADNIGMIIGTGPPPRFAVRPLRRETEATCDLRNRVTAGNDFARVRRHRPTSWIVDGTAPWIHSWIGLEGTGYREDPFLGN